MLRSSSLAIGVLAGAAMIGPAAAQERPAARTGPYLGIVGGAELFDNNEAGAVGVEFDTGLSVGGLFGYQFEGWRLEGELGYRSAAGTSDAGVDADVDVTSGTVGAFFDLPLGRTAPYVGGGLGLAGVSADGDFEDDDTAIVWFAEAGLSVRLNQWVSLVPAYRYSAIDTDLGGFEDSLTGHSLRLAARFELGGPGSAAAAAAPGAYYEPYRGYSRYPYYYDDYRYRDRYRDRPPPTPEERERNRCGWQGPGCPE
jgi:opacity protein-like surface antigen